MKLHRLPLLAVVATFALPHINLNAQTTVATDPVGFVTVTIPAGTTTTKKNTFFSIPLQEVDSTVAGQSSGALTAVTSNSLVNSNAGWSPGALSQPATPFIVQLTSGAGAGRIFLVASGATTGGASGNSALSNTATTIYISPLDSVSANLTNIGIAAGNTYKLYSCDTLGSLFGTNAPSGVRGGSSVTNADTVTTILNGGLSVYWYSTTLNRWAKQGPGSADSANVALVPNYGMIYGRQTNSALTFTVTGQVPVSARSAMIKNSGQTMLSSYWPSTTTLSNLGLQSLPIWTASTVFSNADYVVLTASGSSVNYWWDATANSGAGSWRRQGPGNPLTNPVIDIGTAVQINQRGTAAGYTPITNNVPYTLN